MKKYISFKYILSSATVFLLGTLPFVANADQTSGATGQITTIKNPFNGGDSLMQLIATVLNNVVMPIAAVLAVCYIIWAGFKFVLAQGKEKELADARTNLLHVLIGVGILLGAAAISAVIQATVGALITK